MLVQTRKIDFSFIMLQFNCIKALDFNLTLSILHQTQRTVYFLLFQIAHVLKRDKSKCEAMLQLLSDRDTVLKTNYDSICEYVGDVNEEFDF